MERYIDADIFRKTMIKRFRCVPCLTDYSDRCVNDIHIDDALNLAPTADVVSREDYDAVIAAQESLQKYIATQGAEIERLKKLLDDECDACIERERVKVAREIFAEIEFEIANLDFDRDETRAIAIEGIIANAKKKYTDGKST